MDLRATYEEFTKGFIYFIQGEITKRIKIGFTKRKLSIRIGQLQVGSPDKLSLLGWLWGNEDVEFYIQNMWWHLRDHGEWFNASPELLKYITENNCADN
jgi:hypothetical protein